MALLRAVNVGGTGTLGMAELRSACAACGFAEVRTLGASGNAAFHADAAVPEVRAALAAQLTERTGRSFGLLVRTVEELGEVLARNPFPEQPGNRVVVLFLDRAVTADDLAGVTGQGEHEAVLPGRRELYVRYGAGMGRSRLRIPAAEQGTARNLNTLRKLAATREA